jgi:hypothetical protein
MQARMLEQFQHMQRSGKVAVKNKADFTVKESVLTGLYIDYTVVLLDGLHS